MHKKSACFATLPNIVTALFSPGTCHFFSEFFFRLLILFGRFSFPSNEYRCEYWLYNLLNELLVFEVSTFISSKNFGKGIVHHTSSSPLKPSVTAKCRLLWRKQTKRPHLNGRRKDVWRTPKHQVGWNRADTKVVWSLCELFQGENYHIVVSKFSSFVSWWKLRKNDFFL